MVLLLLRGILVGWLLVLNGSSSLTVVETRRSTLRPWMGDGPILGWCEETRGRQEHILDVSVGWNTLQTADDGGNDDDDGSEQEDDDDILHLSLPGPRDGGVSASLWPSGIAASILMRSPEFRSLVKDKAILELGAGLGLTGMTAGSTESASKLILTDNDEETVELLGMALKRNGDVIQAADAKAKRLDWRDVPIGDDLTPVDIVVGSDVAYYFPLLRPIMDTAKRFLTKSTSLLFLAGQANRESQWDLYKNIRDGSYNQLTDEKEPSWPGQTKMLLFKLDMSKWREEGSNVDFHSPELCDGFVPINFLVHSNMLELGPFTDYDHVATEEDSEGIFKSF